MRRVLSFLALACATGCAWLGHGSGHEWVTPRPAIAPPRDGVILYGVERGAAASAAPGCERLGTVRAWSQGEKTFPYSDFRAAAEEAGGDGVTDVRPDPANQERGRPVHLGEVVRCAKD